MFRTQLLWLMRGFHLLPRYLAWLRKCLMNIPPLPLVKTQ